MDTVGSPEKADRLDRSLPHVQESVFLLKKLLLGRIFPHPASQSQGKAP